MIIMNIEHKTHKICIQVFLSRVSLTNLIWSKYSSAVLLNPCFKLIYDLSYVFVLVFLIPQRYILGIMGFLAVVNAYTMRVILSVAITEMVVQVKSDHFDPNTCSMDIENSTKPLMVSK